MVTSDEISFQINSVFQVIEPWGFVLGANGWVGVDWHLLMGYPMDLV